MTVSDQTNSLHVTNDKSENFVIDVARLSHNFKQQFQRSLSRKTNSTTDNERQISKIDPSASPRVTIGGPTKLEKQNMVPANRAQTHHQITINTNINAGGGGGAESRSPVKSPNFRRSRPSWAFDPRKMFILLATMSSIGTILLIYLTLSVSNPSGDDITQNW